MQSAKSLQFAFFQQFFLRANNQEKNTPINRMQGYLATGARFI